MNHNANKNKETRKFASVEAQKIVITGAIIVALIGLIGVGINALVTYLSSTTPIHATQTAEAKLSSIAMVTVRVENSGGSSVLIKKNANIFLTRQQEGSTSIDAMLPVECDLLTSDGHEIQGELIEIPPGETVLKVQVPTSLMRTLETGEWDLFLGFVRSEGSSFVSETLPFTEDTITKYSIQARIEK